VKLNRGNNPCLFSLLLLTIFLSGSLQAPYNVLLYKDRPRLGTALELLKATQELEQRLEEVYDIFPFDLLFITN